jgi:flagellar basal-body rod modification protein FlgD
MTTNTVNNNNSTNSTTKAASKMSLKAEDFIKMMITQLQNQDPMEPAKNEQLLAQMSQIGQLQASTDLQTSLKTLVLQNNIGSASSLIGKKVNGLDEKGAKLDGIVTSVRVENDQVSLDLDNGKSVSLSNVISIAQTTPATATAA